MILGYELDEVAQPVTAEGGPQRQMPGQFAPECSTPACFIGSYAPVTPAGQLGPFWTNTYFLQADRNKELAGPVKVKSV